MIPMKNTKVDDLFNDQMKLPSLYKIKKSDDDNNKNENAVCIAIPELFKS